MTKTSHGHHIFGTPDTDELPDMARARCGGPGLCLVCSREAHPAYQGGKRVSDAFAPKEFQTRVEKVEAFQLTRSNYDHVARWCGGRVVEDAKSSDPTDIRVVVKVPTLDGTINAEIGEYVVRDPSTGQFSVGDDKKFSSKFEELSSEKKLFGTNKPPTRQSTAAENHWPLPGMRGPRKI